jgi:hypothetical protein
VIGKGRRGILNPMTSPMAATRWLWILAPLMLLSPAGCGKQLALPADALPGDLLPAADLGGNGGEAGAGAVVDFAVSGCPTHTAGNCSGPVPLDLTFMALVDSSMTQATWDVGDGSESRQGLVVTHQYAQPGAYDVTLTVGVAGGTVSEHKDKLVQASAAGPGSACSADSHCINGKCVCTGGSCQFPLDSGLCLKSCEKSSHCTSGTDLTCVDMSGGAASNAEPWHTHLCLPTCTTDADCSRPGFSCRLAPGVGGWRRACLPPSPRFIGEPCRKTSGALDDSRCLGGRCVDLGAGGYCTAACTPGSCPDGTRCARLAAGGGKDICLLRCGSCSGDPWLACELPSKAGLHGFEILGTGDPAGTRYCAPRRCTQDSECGLGGSCSIKDGGFCVAAGM